MGFVLDNCLGILDIAIIWRALRLIRVSLLTGRYVELCKHSISHHYMERQCPCNKPDHVQKKELHLS